MRHVKTIFDDNASNLPRGRAKVIRIAGGTALLVLLYSIGSTLAANINIGTGTTEFGQGIQVTTACDSQITVTPKAAFNNTATPTPAPTPTSARGAFLLGAIEVSNIDNVACDGKWFTLKSFDSNSSSPLQLIDGALSFSVLNTAGTYSSSQSGFTVATNSVNSFTINFTTPMAMSRDVTRVTLESSNALPVQMVVTYSIGSVGPGGGNVFYFDANGFNCGSSFTSTGSPTGGLCKYLEAAPVTWAGGSSDPTKVWSTAGFTSTDITGITNDASAYNNAAAIGLGFKNSALIVNQGNTSASAAGSARAYSGGGKSDWYLPTTAELNLLCQWARGMVQNVAAGCTSGSDNPEFDTNPAYWSSSEVAADQARVQYFNNSGGQDNRAKGDSNKVRPIRAF